MRSGVLTGLLLILLVACSESFAPNSQDSSTKQASPKATPAAEEKTPNGADVVLVGAGNIASSDDLAGAEATAELLDKIPGTVFAVGDLAYPEGMDEQFAKWSWIPGTGRVRALCRPQAGPLTSKFWRLL